jgi:hypothetical protein
MHARTKLHILSASYGAVLASMNWFRSVQYSRTNGVIAESVFPVALAVLLSGMVACYLAVRCFRLARTRLESGSKVREGKWIRSWAIIVYALPLLWHQTSTSTSQAEDGATVVTTGGYGHALSAYLFMFAIVGLLLFQISTRLHPDDQEPSTAPDSTAGSVTARAGARVATTFSRFGLGLI